MAQKQKQALVALLFISLLCNIFIITYMFSSKIPDNIVGTYCNGSGVEKDDIYFVLDSRWLYTVYQQGNLIESGKFEFQDTENNIIKLTSDKQKDNFIVYDGHDNIYYYSSVGVEHYKRISKEAVYINIKHN